MTERRKKLRKEQKQDHKQWITIQIKKYKGIPNKSKFPFRLIIFYMRVLYHAIRSF